MHCESERREYNYISTFSVTLRYNQSAHNINLMISGYYS